MSGFMGNLPPKAPFGDMNVLLLDVSMHYTRKQLALPFDPAAEFKSRAYAFEWLVRTINDFGSIQVHFPQQVYATLGNAQFLMVEVLLSIVDISFKPTVEALFKEPRFVAFAKQQASALLAS